MESNNNNIFQQKKDEQNYWWLELFFQLVKKCKQVLLDLFHISQGLLINRVIGQSNSLKCRLDIYGRQIQLSIPIIFFQNTE